MNFFWNIIFLNFIRIMLSKNLVTKRLWILFKWIVFLKLSSWTNWFHWWLREMKEVVSLTCHHFLLLIASHLKSLIAVLRHSMIYTLDQHLFTVTTSILVNSISCHSDHSKCPVDKPSTRKDSPTLALTNVPSEPCK